MGTILSEEFRYTKPFFNGKRNQTSEVLRKRPNEPLDAAIMRLTSLGWEIPPLDHLQVRKNEIRRLD